MHLKKHYRAVLDPDESRSRFRLWSQTRTPWFDSIAEAREAGERLRLRSEHQAFRIEWERPVLKRFIGIALLLNGILLPTSCIPVLCALNAYNPMALVFVTDITVENKLEESIHATPIGTVGNGKKCPLPVQRWKSPCLPAAQRGGFRVGPGERITIYYDWDDINFSEMVIEDAQGKLFQIIANPDPVSRQYVVAPKTAFVIDDLSVLGPVDPGVLKAFKRANRPAYAVYALPFLTLLPFTFWFLWWRNRKPHFLPEP